MAAISKYKLQQSFKKVILLLIPFSTLVLAGTYILVPLLYGPEYQAAFLPIALVVSSSMFIIYAYFNSILVGENKYSSFFITILIIDFGLSLILNTLLSYLFIVSWGIIGAPIATGLTLLIKIILNVYAIKKLRQRQSLGQSPEETTYHASAM